MKPREIRANPTQGINQLTQVYACPPEPIFAPNTPYRTVHGANLAPIIDRTYVPPTYEYVAPLRSQLKFNHDIVITCKNKHCKPTTYDHNTHYVTRHNYTTHASPQHCPMCPAPGSWITSRSFDYADILILKFPRMNHFVASRMIEEYNNERKFTCVEDMIEQSFPKLVTSTGICPLHVSCNDCKATFTILRTNPTAHDNPKYCIWCSSTHITVTLPSTDDTATLVLNLDLIEQHTLTMLAEQYVIPMSIMTALYEEWNKQASIKTIADWMNTDGAQQIIKLVHATRK